MDWNNFKSYSPATLNSHNLKKKEEHQLEKWQKKNRRNGRNHKGKRAESWEVEETWPLTLRLIWADWSVGFLSSSWLVTPDIIWSWKKENFWGLILQISQRRMKKGSENLEVVFAWFCTICDAEFSRESGWNFWGSKWTVGMRCWIHWSNVHKYGNDWN